MNNIKRFLYEYGHITFEEMPFCDADCFVLSTVFYMPLNKVISPEFEESPPSVSEISAKMFAANGYKHLAPGLVLQKKYSVLLQDLRYRRRYQNVKVTGCKYVFEEETNTQFCAATFILPDGTPFVLYQGTDDTLCGWKEDLDILKKGTIGSHKLGVEYLETVAEKFDGDIIVSGHSKGGHVALYSALFCSAETRARIVKLYNNEGPGLVNRSYYDSKEYRSLLPVYRHFVPQSSFIGMLLAPDFDYTVIKSNIPFIGPAQHDMYSWMLNGGDAATLNELDYVGKVSKLALTKLMDRADDDLIDLFYEVVCGVVDACGHSCLLDLSHDLVPSIKRMAAAWKGFDDDMREDFADALKLFAEIVKESIEELKSAPQPTPAQA